MSENLLLSLQITALGMGIVFGAIILLSVIMSLLTRLTADREVSPATEAGVSDSTIPAPVMEKQGFHKLRAMADPLLKKAPCPALGQRLGVL